MFTVCKSMIVDIYIYIHIYQVGLSGLKEVGVNHDLHLGDQSVPPATSRVGSLQRWYKGPLGNDFLEITSPRVSKNGERGPEKIMGNPRYQVTFRNMTYFWVSIRQISGV